MKIDGPGPLRPGALRRADRPQRTGGPGFASHLQPEDNAVAGPAAAQPMAPIDALLALQEVPDSLQARRRTVRRGNDLLERPDEIRHALLLGALPLARLQNLMAALRQQHQAAPDPRLAEVLAEIELRCRVELAKLGQVTDM
jgi:hypothetical protein